LQASRSIDPGGPIPADGFEYESENDLNVNLDGEPTLVKQFRVECRRCVLPVHLGDSPLISRYPRPF